MRRIPLACFVCSAFILLLPAQEQTPAPPNGAIANPDSLLKVAPPPADPDELRISSEVEVVLLDVSVKDAKGGWVSGLDKANFKVFEDKAEQKISIFAKQDTPVTVGLVVDNSGSVRPKKADIVTAALTFVTQSNPHDEMFIVNFNDHVMMGLPDDIAFTDDSKLLRQALLINQPQGRTALYDALKTALDHLDKGRLDKKTLVVISDGGDNASETTKRDILRLVESSPATIYTVGIFNPEDKDKNPGFLHALSNITGGESFIPENTNNLVGICEKIAHDIRNRYSLGYTPTNRAQDGKIRRVRVLANGENGVKYEARTRSHYYARVDMPSATAKGKGKQK